MQAFVLDKHKNPLMPCHPARARELLEAEVIEAGIICIQRMGGVEAWKDFDEAFNPESESNRARAARWKLAEEKED